MKGEEEGRQGGGPGTRFKDSATSMPLSQERLKAELRRKPDALAELSRGRAWIRVREGTESDLLGGDAILSELASGSDVTVPDRPCRWFTKALERVPYTGKLLLRTGLGFPAHQLRVQTAEGHIELGTTAVSEYKGNDFTCVFVLEGTARIEKDEAGMEKVAAGLSKVMFSGDRPSTVHTIEP